MSKRQRATTTTVAAPGPAARRRPAQPAAEGAGPPRAGGLRGPVPEIKPVAGQPSAWAASCFYLVGCALLVAALISAHLEDSGDQLMTGVLAGVCGAAGIVLVLSRAAAPGWVRLAAILLGLGVVTVAASSAQALGGLLVASFGYLWAAVYLGYFFAGRQLVALTGLTAACVAFSLAISGVADPALAGVVVVVTVTAGVAVLRRLVELLEYRATTDPLTGLLNRNGLELATSRALAERERGRVPLSLAVVDLDEFSKVNNRLGHFAADRLLLQLADHWRSALGPGDVVGRLGGDEFLFLMPGLGVEEARARLTQAAMEAPLQWSAGVVELEERGVEEAVAEADRRLLVAKAQRHRPT